MKEFNKNNPDKIKMYRERKQSKKHIVTQQEWIDCKQYFNNACAYCGLPAEEHYQKYRGELKRFDLHKEHIDDKGSPYLDNCIPACHLCNESKHTATLEEWYDQSKPFYSELRLLKINKWRTEDYKKYMTTIPMLSINNGNDKNEK